MQDTSSDDHDAKTKWAEDRTDWAEDRTVLANERTFAGWMRTGMAAIAIAVGLKAVFREAEVEWIPKAVSTVFIVAAMLIFWSARRNACSAQQRLQAHDAEVQTTRMFTILSIVFSVGGATVGFVLWTL